MRIIPLFFKHLRLRHFAIIYAEHLSWIPYDIPSSNMFLDAKAISRAGVAVRKLSQEASIQTHHLAVYQKKSFRNILFGPLLSSMRTRCGNAKEAEQRFFDRVYNLPRNVTVPMAKVDLIMEEVSWVRNKFR